jgi:hypothetical protein
VMEHEKPTRALVQLGQFACRHFCNRSRLTLVSPITAFGGRYQIDLMNKTMIEIAVVSLLGASLAFPEEAKVETNSDRISLFSVALICPAAPEMGCGTVAKPVLLELQRQPGIAEAWLKGTGTVLAVVGTDSNPESRVKTVQSTLQKNGVVATELNGENRELELKSFVSRYEWYHGSEVDSLTKCEAEIIAARSQDWPAESRRRWRYRRKVPKRWRLASRRPSATG